MEGTEGKLSAGTAGPAPEEQAVFRLETQPEGKVVPSLSKRQRQVLILLTQGMAPKQIALRTGISRRMVGYHMRHLLDKLEVQSTSQLVGRAVAMGLCKAS